MPAAEAQILTILLGERGSGYHHAREIDALPLLENSSFQHPGPHHDLVLDLLDLEDEAAVVEEDPVPGRHVVGELAVGRGQELARAGILGVVDDAHGLVLPELDHPAVDPADPDLGPLEVLQDRHRHSQLVRSRADRVDDARILFVIAVGEVQTRAVHARGYQLADDLGALAGGSQRAQDLGSRRPDHEGPR